MQITKEYIQNKIEELQKQYDQHIANANAVQGAILTCQQDLAYLDAPELGTPDVAQPSEQSGKQSSEGNTPHGDS